MAHHNFRNHKVALAAARPDASAGDGAAPEVSVVDAAAKPAVGLDFIVRDVLAAGAGKAKALLRVYLHSRKVRAAAHALAEALAESRDVWNWPGDRLPVGAEMSQQVEKLTRRLKLETEAHYRLEALFRTAAGGRSVPAL
ncbi:hypothetical protein [Arthrobacter sp. RT-1]|uniref:hypothetical protein n=1 Tax=Arthrobacter sp. RT-1 TaxID=2292263 RepID=UPI0021637819|nr:hypothetical protein [Arthrobacter sp. RT-1]